MCVFANGGGGGSDLHGNGVELVIIPPTDRRNRGINLNVRAAGRTNDFHKGTWPWSADDDSHKKGSGFRKKIQLVKMSNSAY